MVQCVDLQGGKVNEVLFECSGLSSRLAIPIIVLDFEVMCLMMSGMFLDESQLLLDFMFDLLPRLFGDVVKVNGCDDLFA